MHNFRLTNFSLLFAADVRGLVWTSATKSNEKLVNQKYVTLFLSWMSFSKEISIKQNDTTTLSVWHQVAEWSSFRNIHFNVKSLKFKTFNFDLQILHFEFYFFNLAPTISYLVPVKQGYGIITRITNLLLQGPFYYKGIYLMGAIKLWNTVIVQRRGN